MTKPPSQVLTDIKAIIEEIYIKFEYDEPPMTFNKHEARFNEGLYKGELKAMETVVQAINEYEVKGKL